MSMERTSGAPHAMSDLRQRGFSLVELAIVLVVMGLLLGFSVPSFQRLSASYQLRGASENIAGQLRLAREKAIATGVAQPVHILNSTTYHMHYPSPIGITTTWTLPRGITFTSPTVGSWYHLQSDGRSQESGVIVVGNTRGALDTVSVQLSGLVLIR
jgi:prepilin-type N-terminal cleavage/methylation domain-containing protein